MFKRFGLFLIAALFSLQVFAIPPVIEKIASLKSDSGTFIQMKTLSDVGVTLCVETHGGVTALDNGALLHFNSVSTRSDCWKEILKTGVSMTFDPANLTAVGINAPEAFYLQFKEAVHYVHLKDFKDVPGGIVPAACGEGRINWKTLLEAMKDCDLPAMIEYEIPADVKVGMKRSLDFLRKNA